MDGIAATICMARMVVLQRAECRACGNWEKLVWANENFSVQLLGPGVNGPPRRDRADTQGPGIYPTDAHMAG